MKESYDNDGAPLQALVGAAADGDDAALAAVLARMMPIVQWYARGAVCPGLDYDDAVQEGLIALLSAIRTFRPTGGAAFTTYGGACVRNAIGDASRAARAAKRAPAGGVLSLSDEAGDGSYAPDPALVTQQREQVAGVLRTIDNRLSSLEKRVLALVLSGHTYGQTARRLGLSEKAVDNAMQRARKKLRSQP